MRTFCAQIPLHNVDIVRAQVGHLAAGVIPEPAEMVQRAMRIVGTLGRGAQPHVVIEIRRRRAIRRVAESGHHIAVGAHVRAQQLAEIARLHQFAGLLIMRSGALLGAHLHDALVAARGVGHPAAFFHEQGERLFDVDIFARRAGHDGEQCVPVVGRTHHHGLNIFIVQQFSKIAIGFGAGSTRREALFQARLADFAHGGQVGVFLIFEIVDMLAADQAVADEAHLDAIVGAQQPRIGRRRDRPQEHTPRRVHLPEIVTGGGWDG